MTKLETVKLIAFLGGSYDSIATRKKEQKDAMIATWYMCLHDLDYAVVLEAVKQVIMTSPYVPTVAEIRKRAMDIMRPKTDKTPIELWNEAYRLIARASRVTPEEFNQEPIEIKRFFGSIKVLQTYGYDPDFNLGVTRSNFLSQCQMIQESEEQKKMLPEIPQETKIKLDELTKKFLGG